MLDDPDSHRVAILFKDITHKRRADELLRNSEHQALEAARQAEAEHRRLDAVLEAVPVGIVVSDASGVILHANHAFKRFWGVRHPQSHGTDNFRQWKGWWADRSERHGRRLEPDEWTMARILRGEEAIDDIIEIESFDTPPVRRIVLKPGATIIDAMPSTSPCRSFSTDVVRRRGTNGRCDCEYTGRLDTGGGMTQNEILDMFRQQSDNMAHALPAPNVVILELAQLLAESRGRISKENFETLVRIGGVLYKVAFSQFEARSDVAEIMRKSGESRKDE